MPHTVGLLIDALLALDRSRVRRILLEAGSPDGLEAAFEELMTTALEEIGAEWEKGRVALSQIYMAGRICEEAIDELLPPREGGRHGAPRLAIATFDDYHMLGKRLVYSMLRAAGYQVFDYGRAELESLLFRVREDRVDILLLSVLMLPAALHIADLRRRIDQAGLKLKVIVGGAPFRFDATLWREVGADAMGRTASDAITLVRRFSGGIA
ncbi:cobalamin B12-binding domain-containing protein [Geomesophilobacter sediminis]|uniref:Cobalamin-dependent protein n=1 Tax=Geomesophilobacter sediminis TaxID=2798584 RepID=A0A8J7JAW7_9BACT|nr:cobalamin-dependent protein [Geomesophilobacter sediminis]MBJ6724146.1 cobalamin-dependent protein [Geomesophilobacter sediminis]